MRNSMASEKGNLLKKMPIFLMIAFVGLSFAAFERSREETTMRLQKQTQKQMQSKQAATTLRPKNITFLPLYGSENTTDNMIQALVLSPEKGIVVAIGTAAVHDCPQPNYEGRNLTLSLGEEAFPITRFNQFELDSGPVVVAHFNVTDVVWEKLRQRPLQLRVDNQFDQTTQHLTPMVDPALTQGWGQHKLSATVTVRKHYRFYKGRIPPTAKSKGPQTWTVEHTQERLDWWFQHYRSLGVEHFYVIDNEHDQLLPNLMVNGTDVTYIRAANHEYDYPSCLPERKHFVSGQSLFENMVIRMAHTEWLIVLDIDEFIVPNEPFKDNLVSFLDHYKSIRCIGKRKRGLLKIACKPLQQVNLTVDKNNYTFDKRIHAMSFRGFSVNPQGNFSADPCNQRKNILMPTYTAYLDVHVAIPFPDREEIVSNIPSKRAYMAHLRDDAQEPGSHLVMADIVPLLRNNHDSILFDSQ